MNDSRGSWLDQVARAYPALPPITLGALTAAESTTILLGGRISLSLADLIQSYAAGIAAVIREQDTELEMRTDQERGLDDYIAALMYRDKIEILMSELDDTVHRELRPLVDVVDEQLRDQTVDIKKDVRAGGDDEPWWWRRSRARGPWLRTTNHSGPRRDAPQKTYHGAIHKRWIADLNRSNDESDPRYQKSWAWEQCGGCRFWMPIAGVLGSDWGACSNAASPFDRRVMFEHDGCDCFEEDPEGWRTPGRAPIPADGE